MTNEGKEGKSRNYEVGVSGGCAEALELYCGEVIKGICSVGR